MVPALLPMEGKFTSWSGQTGEHLIDDICSLLLPPIETSNGSYDALGYYAAPADGNLLGGPVFTSPLMTAELCGTDCQGYSYFALENGKVSGIQIRHVLALISSRQ